MRPVVPLLLLFTAALCVAESAPSMEPTGDDGASDDVAKDDAGRINVTCTIAASQPLTRCVFTDRDGCDWSCDPDTLRVFTEYGPRCHGTVPIDLGRRREKHRVPIDADAHAPVSGGGDGGGETGAP